MSLWKVTVYGLIVKMTVAPGQRDELVGILVQGTGVMPGCFCYVVAKDAAQDNAIWITEVWDTKESHDSSLQLPEVKIAIARGKPMITGVTMNVLTTPVGGFGLGAVGEITETTP